MRKEDDQKEKRDGQVEKGRWTNTKERADRLRKEDKQTAKRDRQVRKEDKQTAKKERQEEKGR